MEEGDEDYDDFDAALEDALQDDVEQGRPHRFSCIENI